MSDSGGNKSIRVLQIVPGVSSGSSMVFSRLQMDALERHGVTIHRHFLGARAGSAQLIHMVRRLAQTVAEFKPDIVHAQYGSLTALLAATTSLVPLVVTFRGSDLNPDPGVWALRSYLQKAMSHLAALRAHRIICVSEQLKQRLIWGRGRAEVIPSGVDTNIFNPADRDLTRQELGWSADERVVLFNASGPPAVKRVDRAQAVMSLARRALGNLRFMVINGSYTPAQVCKFMNAADCLLLTSDWEGSPTVVQESMACNLPVVTTNAGDVTQQLAGIEPSFIAGPDAASMARSLAAILENPRRSNGREAALKVCHDVLAVRLIEIYGEMLDG